MRVPHSEGVANHTDPLSCVGHREVSGEALAGESIGQPLSRESRFNPGCRRRFGRGRQARRRERFARIRSRRDFRLIWNLPRDPVGMAFPDVP